MKGYWSLFRIRFINALQYRTVALGAFLTRFVWGLMEVLLYTALYRGGAAPPMDYRQIVSYLWLQQVFFAMFSVVFSDGEIQGAIADGGVAYELTRPLDLYGRWFCQAVANRVAPTVTQFMPALIFAFLMPAPYALRLPDSAAQGLLFLLSVALAVGVVAAFAMLMYISLFYTLSSRGVKVMVTAVTTFLSGGTIPLAFFPDTLLRVIRFLPFASMQNAPLSIYAGSIAGAEALWTLLLQAFWLAALVMCGRTFMRRALRRVVVQGG